MPHRTPRTWTLLLLLGLALGACRGGVRQAAQAAPPERIVSTVPAVTEMLFAMGAGKRIVAVSSFDKWPPEVLQLPKVGGLLDPDVEQILALKPDLLVADASQQDVLDKAKAAGIVVFPYKLGGLDNLPRTLLDLGRVLGAEREAQAAAGSITKRLEAIRRRAAGRPRPRTLVVFGREPGAMRGIDASGGVGFLHDIVELAGGENVFGQEKKEWVRVSLEALLAARPDVVVELHYGYYLTPARLRTEMAVWNGLTTLPAVRAKRVHLLEGDKYVVPGPRIVEAAEEIAAVIHPR